MPGLLSYDSDFSNGHTLKTSALEQCLETLNREVKTLVEQDQQNRTNLDKVSIDAEAFKAAYVSSEDKRKKLLEHTTDLEKHTSDMNNQLKAHRVTVIVDGDGAIFNPDLVAKGSSGGHTAARMLNDQICEQLAEIAPFQLRAYVFLNKRGLADALGRCGQPIAKNKLDDFVLGINQAAERFWVVDVGYGKEAADGKVRTCLDDELRLPQNLKVIFAGCHDNGYVSTLRSHITAGYGSKLLLLPGYKDMAAGIADLNLPEIIVPDLFLQYKLRPVSPAADLMFKREEQAYPPAPPAPPPPPPPTRLPTRMRSSTNPPTMEPLLSSSPNSYSSILAKRSMTPDFAPRSESPNSIRSNSTGEPCKSGRHPTDGLPLSKHKPAPCSMFYLTGSGCSAGSTCKYGHDYLLGAEHYDEMRANAKKGPCPYVNKDELCPWDDDCIHGHLCPSMSNTGSCRFYKERKCKFGGATMHRV